MNRCFALILLIIITLPSQIAGQETSYGPGYQMIMRDNPAFSGSETDGKLRLSYLNFYPGNNYNLHSVYASYDSYFPRIHGGAGLYFSNDYLGGIVNDVRCGLSYAYFLQAGENIYINAGLSAALYHRGFSFGNAILPDQINPLEDIVLPSGEALAASGRTVFDIGAGFLFISGKIIGGVSINHLSEPDLSSSGLLNETINRKLNLQLAGDFNMGKKANLKLRPLATLEMQRKFLSGGAGAVFESSFISFSLLAIGSNENNLDLQTGFSLHSGKLNFFYNYRFNLISGNNKMMPFSLLYQTGLAFSLNHFDKRNSVKTINYPKL